MPKLIAIMLIAASFGATSGCSAPATAAVQSVYPVGAFCTVQFKRDLLGATMELPISPTTGGINGASVAVSGKLVQINDDWVIIEQDARNNHEIWVPRGNVLLLTIVRPTD